MGLVSEKDWVCAHKSGDSAPTEFINCLWLHPFTGYGEKVIKGFFKALACLLLLWGI